MTPSGRSGAKRPRPKRQRSRTPGRTRASIIVIVEDNSWRKDTAAISLLRRAARAALEMGSARQASRAVTILLTNDARLKELNALFRGRNKPTNVLSFSADEKNYLGDVAIAHGVAAREARNEAKRFAAHAAHLAAHGVLHLMSYDHHSEREAAVMEALESRILARLGLPDPYARPSRAA